MENGITIDEIEKLSKFINEYHLKLQNDLTHALNKSGQTELALFVTKNGLPKQIICSKDMLKSCKKYLSIYCNDIISSEVIDKPTILFSWIDDKIEFSF